MSRAIDADCLLDALNSIILDYTSEGKYPDGFGIDDAINLVEGAPTLTPPNKPMTLEFDVVDTTTGKYPDWERITIEEPWANRLVDCDMDGIAIREDGSLILLDEYGKCVSCPPYRFEIRRPPEGENA